MAKKKTVSIAIAVFNEEGNLSTCLSSVADIASEIVVVDGGSTDRTVAIASQFTSKIIKTDNPPIFHINKQKALDACTGDWILQLDADEVIPDDLKHEILQVTQNDSKIHAYYIPRKNFFWGHFMKKGGQYPDAVIRLVKKGYGHFPCKTVHEQIEIVGEVGAVRSPMLHYTYKTRADYWKKADAYTTLTARKLSVEKNIITWLSFTIWKPLVTFASIFIRHKGFMDGLWGFEFALYSGLHWAIAYQKYLKL